MGNRILAGQPKIYGGTKLNLPLKLGLIGCGRASELIYLPALKKFSGVEITAVVDPIKERRELISKRFRKCFQSDYLDMNVINKIDAAIISTPPDTHVSLASSLLKNNKYILVEKPLALSMDGIKDLIDIEKSSKGSLMMGFNHRNWQPAIDIKKKLSGELKLKSMEIIFTGNYRGWNPVSFISDPLNDLGPHLFDLARFIFSDEIRSISAKSISDFSIDIKIRMRGDYLINCLLAHSDETIKSINVNTEKGNYYILQNSTRILPAPGNRRKILDLNDKIKRKLLRKTSPIKFAFEIQLKNFFNNISLNKHTQPDIKDGVSAIKAVMATRESMNKNGKEIFLDEIK